LKLASDDSFRMRYPLLTLTVVPITEAGGSTPSSFHTTLWQSLISQISVFDTGLETLRLSVRHSAQMIAGAKLLSALKANSGASTGTGTRGTLRELMVQNEIENDNDNDNDNAERKLINSTLKLIAARTEWSTIDLSSFRLTNADLTSLVSGLQKNTLMLFVDLQDCTINKNNADTNKLIGEILRLPLLSGFDCPFVGSQAPFRLADFKDALKHSHLVHLVGTNPFSLVSIISTNRIPILIRICVSLR
jgi:hypothetical protein